LALNQISGIKKFTTTGKSCPSLRFLSPFFKKTFKPARGDILGFRKKWSRFFYW
jgi:hypothetical protein